MMSNDKAFPKIYVFALNESDYINFLKVSGRNSLEAKRIIYIRQLLGVDHGSVVAVTAGGHLRKDHYDLHMIAKCRDIQLVEYPSSNE